MSEFGIIVLALILDHFLGEPKRYHPLVGLGNLTKRIEASLNRATDSKEQQMINGIIGLAILVIPVLLLTGFIARSEPSWIIYILEVLILYLAIGRQSLNQHVDAIYQALQKSDMELGRERVAMIVSRDTQQMQKKDISRAAVESVLENGSDAIFAAIFWYVVAGVPGVVAYRIINTLDAMWGYKTKRYQWFGFAAAKADDILNYIPARLTAISYALVGHWPWAIHCWKTQAKEWQGINPGVVMAAGSGALGVKLGGGDYYHGCFQERPVLGMGETVQPYHIIDSLKLLDRVVYLWLIVFLLIFHPIMGV